MAVRIYQPSKTAMQSGRAGGRDWVVETTSAEAVTVDPLMGWTGSGNTQNQVVLTFDSKEAAIRYAEQQGLAYTVAEPLRGKFNRRSYADNFKFGRIGSWTH